MTTDIRFSDWLNEQLTDPEFKEAYEDLEPAYQVARLRMLKGLTQAQLAELVDTKQSSIARLESGKSQPRLSFLRRVIEALGGRLELHICAEGEMPVKTTITVYKTVPVAPIQIINIQKGRTGTDYGEVIYASSAKVHREQV